MIVVTTIRKITIFLFAVTCVWYLHTFGLQYKLGNLILILSNCLMFLVLTPKKKKKILRFSPSKNADKPSIDSETCEDSMEVKRKIAFANHEYNHFRTEIYDENDNSSGKDWSLNGVLPPKEAKSCIKILRILRSEEQ